MNRKLSLQELNRLTVAEFKTRKKSPIVIILDNVRSALNVGSTFRTADAFALQEIALCGITAQPPHREILKTAIGATESVNWQHFPSTLDAVNYYKEQGFFIYAVEQTENSIQLNEFKATPAGKYAVIMGNEVKGVNQKVIDLADGCLEIPQFGTKHSLNVSVCTGIIIWELFRQKNIKNQD